jgi:2-phosphosulfolactate phosphatase
VVVIDVFRAGNTAAAILQRGAERIIVARTLEEARGLKADRPDYILVGERKGVRPPDFDMNNSPHLASRTDFAGKTAVLTTSAGSAGLAAAAPTAQFLIMATLANAANAVSYLRRCEPEIVTLAAIGTEGRRRAEEDDAAADYLAGLLRGEAPDYRGTVRRMLSGEGSARLRRLGQVRDLAWCLRLDHVRVVPRAVREWGLLELRRGAAELK